MIRHTYAVDPTVAVQAAQSVGLGDYQQQQAQQDLATQKYLLSLEEQQRQFDLGAEQRAISTAQQQAKYYDQQRAAMVRDRNHTLATQQNAEAQRQHALALSQQNFGQQAAMEQQRQGGQMDRSELSYYADSGKELEKAADNHFKELRKNAPLDPDGQQKFRDLQAKFEKVRGMRGTLRPQAYAEAMGQFMTDLSEADLPQYQVHQPTKDEAWEQETRTDEYGRVFSKNRSGAWTQTAKPLPKEVGYQELPNGLGGVYTANDGRTIHIPPPRPDSSGSKPKMSDYVKRAHANLLAKHQVNSPVAGDGPKFDPKDEDIKAEAQRLYRIEHELEQSVGQGDGEKSVPSVPNLDEMAAAAQGLPQRPQGGQPQLQPGETIVTNAQGKSAILHTDGTVTPID